MPLNWIQRKCKGGYKFRKLQEKIIHFLYATIQELDEYTKRAKKDWIQQATPVILTENKDKGENKESRKQN